MGVIDLSGEANNKFKGGCTKKAICAWAGISDTSADAQELVADIRAAVQKYIPKGTGARSVNDQRRFRLATQHLRGKWTATAKHSHLGLRDRQLWFERVRVGYAATQVSSSSRPQAPHALPQEADEYYGVPPTSAAALPASAKPSARIQQGIKPRAEDDDPGIGSSGISRGANAQSTVLTHRPGSTTPAPQQKPAADTPMTSIEGDNVVSTAQAPSDRSESRATQPRQMSTIDPPSVRQVDWEFVVARVNVENLRLEDLEGSEIKIPLSLVKDEKDDLNLTNLLDTIEKVIQEEIEDASFTIDWQKYKIRFCILGEDDVSIMGPIKLKLAQVMWQKTDEDDVNLVLEQRGIKRDHSRTPPQAPSTVKRQKVDSATTSSQDNDQVRGEASGSQDVPMEEPSEEDEQGENDQDNDRDEDFEPENGSDDATGSSSNPGDRPSSMEADTDADGPTQDNTMTPAPAPADQDGNEDGGPASSSSDPRPTEPVDQPDQPDDTPQAPPTEEEQLQTAIENATDGFITLTEEDFAKIADFSDSQGEDDERSEVGEELTTRLQLRLDDSEDDDSGNVTSTNRITERWTRQAYDDLARFTKLDPFTVWNREAGFLFPHSGGAYRTKPYQLLAILFAIQRLHTAGGLLLMDMAGYGKTYEVFSLISYCTFLLKQRARTEREVQLRQENSNRQMRHLDQSIDHFGLDCSSVNQIQCYCKKDGLARQLGDMIQDGPTVIVAEKTNLNDPWVNAYSKIYANARADNCPKLILWHTDTLQSQGSSKNQFQLTDDESKSLKAQHGPDWAERKETVSLPEQRRKVDGKFVKHNPTQDRKYYTGSLVNQPESSNIIILTTPQSFPSFLEKWAAKERCETAYFRPARIIMDEAHKSKKAVGGTCFGVADRVTVVPQNWRKVRMTLPDIVALSATPWSHNIISEMRPGFLETVNKCHTETDRWCPSKARPELVHWDKEALTQMADSAKRYELLIKNTTDAGKKQLAIAEPDYIRDAISFMETFCIGRGPDTKMFRQPVTRVPELSATECNVAFNDEQTKLANDPLKDLHQEALQDFNSMMQRWNALPKNQQARTKKPELTEMTKTRGSRSPLVRIASSFPCVVQIAKDHRDEIQQYLDDTSSDEVRYKNKSRSQLTSEDKSEMVQLRMTVEEARDWGWYKNYQDSPYYKHRDELMQSPKVDELKRILSQMQASRFPKYSKDGSKILDRTGRDKMLALSESPMGALMMFIVLRELVTPGTPHFMGEQMDIMYNIGGNMVNQDRDELVDRLNERPTKGAKFAGKRPRIMVGTTMQLGTGLNFESVRYMVVLEPPSNLKLKRQIPYRIVRVGSYGVRFVYWIHNTRSTWETLLLQRHMSYENVLKRINEGHDDDEDDNADAGAGDGNGKGKGKEREVVDDGEPEDEANPDFDFDGDDIGGTQV